MQHSEFISTAECLVHVPDHVMWIRLLELFIYIIEINNIVYLVNDIIVFVFGFLANGQIIPYITATAYLNKISWLHGKK